MQQHELPTWNEIVAGALASLDTARTALSDARDWIAGDWRPVGTSLTRDASDARIEVRRGVAEINDRIDQLKAALYRAENGTGTRKA